MPREGSSREARRAGRSGGIHQLGWRQVTNPYRPVEVLREDQIEAIHLASLRILEEIGLDFLHPEALDLLGSAGARRFNRGASGSGSIGT